jgi:asparaginyl-tRNA synthetase
MAASAVSRVYAFGPTFRAESSSTSRHLAEFWMLEPEVAFADLDNVIDLAEASIKHVTKRIMNTCSAEMEHFNKWVDKEALARVSHTLNSEFVRITYTDVIDILLKSGRKWEFQPKWYTPPCTIVVFICYMYMCEYRGEPLQTEHEKWLATEHFKRPVFVTHYPRVIKSFYMRSDSDVLDLKDEKATVITTTTTSCCYFSSNSAATYPTKLS